MIHYLNLTLIYILPEENLKQTGIFVSKYKEHYVQQRGAWGSVVVKALRQQSDGPGIDSQWYHWGFFLWYPRQNHVSTQPLKVSTRDFSWDKGGRCFWLTTNHPCSAETPYPTRNPLGHLGLQQETFTFYCIQII